MKKQLLFLVLLIQGLGVFAQSRVSGTVSDAESGDPIAGVTVTVVGTTKGVITNIDGTYKLSGLNEDAVIKFSYIGYTQESIPVAGKPVINVALKTDTEVLDDVIVVAYGTTTKKSFTGSADVVGAKMIESRAATSATAALEGTTTGLQMLSASGQPGSSATIRIRGMGTLNGSSTPLIILDGAQFNGAITSIDANDISSMTVLKDAASSALYGSRAAGGVIVITTKSGKRSGGQLKFDANVEYAAVGESIAHYEKSNPGQHYELMWQSYKNQLVANGATEEDARIEASAGIAGQLGYNPFDVEDGDIVDTSGNLNPEADVIFQGLDWYDAMSQVGQRTKVNVNASVGGDNYSAYFSTSYLSEAGYVRKSDFERFSSRANLSFSPAKWLEINATLNMSQTTKGMVSTSGGYSDPFYFAKAMPSIYPVWIVDPTTGEYILDAAGEKMYDLGGGYSEYGISARPTNPERHAIAELDYNDQEIKRDNLSQRYEVKLKLTENLTVSATYAPDIQDYLGTEYENDIVGDGAPTGRYSEDRYRRSTTTSTQLINYDNIFDEVHSLSLLGGHESYEYTYSIMSGMKNTQTATGITEFDNFSVVSSLDGSTSDKAIESYFGRVEYNYNHKYYFSGGYRYDGSSVFSEDSRWGGFASFGASWRVDQEEFIQSVSWIDDLKVRASFGQVGNDNISGNYASQALYTIIPNAGEPGIYWSSTGNDGLKWETTGSYDTAVEFSIFDGRLSGSIGYYLRNSTDLLYDMPIPLSNGLNETPKNIASVKNSGVEISLDFPIYEDHDFLWNAQFRASTNKNIITDIPEPFVNGSKRWDIDRSVYDFYLYDYAGVDSDNGDALFYVWEEAEEGGNVTRQLDENGDYLTSNDYTEAGKGYVDATSIPDMFGSVANTFSYKNFSLDLLFTYQFGGDLLDYGYSAMMHAGSLSSSTHVDLLGAWKEEGDVTDIPRLDNSNTTYLAPTMTTRFLTSSDYLAFKSANLSYMFQKSQLETLGLSRVKVYVAAENIFLLSARKGLDPQSNFSGTPGGADFNPSSYFSIGANVSF